MKYKTKSIIIDAEQYKPGMETGFGCIPFNTKKKPFISTSKGNIFVDDGDWIVTDLSGERSIIASDVFEMTYDIIE